MRRGPVFEGFQEEAEAFLKFLFAEAQDVENLFLQVVAVAADAAGGKLHAVADQIVELADDLAVFFRLVQPGNVFLTGQGEHVVGRLPALLFIIVGEKREIGDPGERKQVFRDQLLPYSHFVSKGCQDLGRHIVRICHDGDKVSGCGFRDSDDVLRLSRGEKLADAGFQNAIRHFGKGDALAAVMAGQFHQFVLLFAAVIRPSGDGQGLDHAACFQGAFENLELRSPQAFT